NTRSTRDWSSDVCSSDLRRCPSFSSASPFSLASPIEKRTRDVAKIELMAIARIFLIFTSVLLFRIMGLPRNWFYKRDVYQFLVYYFDEQSITLTNNAQKWFRWATGAASCR